MKDLLVLLVTLTACVASADVFPDAPHVYVEGSAEIRVEPDMLELALVLQKIDPELAAAKADVDERSRKLVAACKKLGIEDADITSSSLQIGPAYDYSGQERRLIGTQVGRPIELRLRNLEKYSELIQAVVAAKADRIDSTVMSSSKREAVLQQAQEKALADARARAERFAAASGQKLGDAYSISEFDHRREERYLLNPARGISLARPGSGQMDYLGAAASEPFEPGTIAATATVYVIYLLDE